MDKIAGTTLATQGVASFTREKEANVEREVIQQSGRIGRRYSVRQIYATSSPFLITTVDQGS